MDKREYRPPQVESYVKVTPHDNGDGTETFHIEIDGVSIDVNDPSPEMQALIDKFVLEHEIRELEQSKRELDLIREYNKMQKRQNETREQTIKRKAKERRQKRKRGGKK